MVLKIIIPQVFLYLILFFHLCCKNMLSAMYVYWELHHLKLVVCYVLHLLVSLPCKYQCCKECNNKLRSPAFDAKRHLACRIELYFIASKVIIVVHRFRYINNKNKFSLQATIDPHGPSMYSDHYTTSINCCTKQSIATTAKLRSFKLLIPKSLLLPI